MSMLFFKKKKEEIKQVFGSFIKSSNINLVLDQNKFNSKYLEKIPCKILGEEELFQLVNGHKPYKLINVDIFVYDSDNVRLNFLNNEYTDIGETFSQEGIDTIDIVLNFKDILKTIQEGWKKTKIKLNFSDIDNNTLEVKLELDLEMLLKQIGPYLEQITFDGFTEAKLKRNYADKLEIELIFHPLITINSIGELKEVRLEFPEDSGVQFVRRISDYLALNVENYPIYRYYLDNCDGIEITDKKKIIHSKVIAGKLVVKTSRTTLVQEIQISSSKLKEGLFKNFSYKDFIEEDLILVHAALKNNFSKFVEHKTFGPIVMYGSPSRPSIHFSLNHVVSSHMYGNWENTDMVILIPFEEALKLNKNTFYGGSTVDIFFVGFIRLPKSTKFIYREGSESWEDFEKRVNEEITELGYPVTVGGMWAWGGSWDATMRLDELMKKLGFGSGAHTGTEFGAADATSTHAYYVKHGDRDKNISKHSDEVRKYWINHFTKEYPELYNKYKKIINAWNSFWTKKGK